MSEKGYLIIETGDVLEGVWFGPQAEQSGELVFNTSMYGYQEILSDPSYKGQILCFCYPLIGNYGIHDRDFESETFHVSGVIIGEIIDTCQHALARNGLIEELNRAGVPALSGVDTRALVQLIRKSGELVGWLSPTLPQSILEFIMEKKSLFTYTAASKVAAVSTKEVKTYHHSGSHVAVIDYGCKKSIIEHLVQRGCKVSVLPYTTTYQEIKLINPDGLVFSNGPGDPMELESLLQDIYQMSHHYPSLGICLGHQLLALAHGATTEKLLFGHRGSNHPVKDLQTGKVYMTAQNHGYVVKEDGLANVPFDVTYINVNDGTIEGFKHQIKPIQTVQFHPEAHSGPNDTALIFDQFIRTIQSTGAVRYAFASGD